MAQPTAALLTSAQLSLALVASSQLATEPLTEAHPAAANTEAEPVKAVTAAESLDNRRMLVLAKKIGEDWESPGKALGLPDEELAEIKEDLDSATYKGAFKMQGLNQSATNCLNEANKHLSASLSTTLSGLLNCP